MKNRELISVIVPVYNTEKYLKRCVDSILNQTYQRLQIILVNDGSTDNSLSIMQEFEKADERVCVIDDVHMGVSVARNTGIREAIGEYVSFIDSDDWIELNTYQRILEILTEEMADAIYYEWKEEYSDGTSIVKAGAREKKKVIEGEEILKKYLHNNFHFRISSGLLKRALLKDTFFEVGREIGEDMLFSFQTIAKANRIVYVDLPLYHRYYRLGSLSNQLGFNRNKFGTATCTTFMVEYIRQHKPYLLQDAYCYSFNFYMVVLNQLSYYKCEKENEDIYESVKKRLKELWHLIDSPARRLAVEVGWAYRVFLLNKNLYHYAMVLYYRYIKRELDGKRQR